MTDEEKSLIDENYRKFLDAIERSPNIFTVENRQEEEEFFLKKYGKTLHAIDFKEIPFNELLELKEDIGNVGRYGFAAMAAKGIGNKGEYEIFQLLDYWYSLEERKSREEFAKNIDAYNETYHLITPRRMEWVMEWSGGDSKQLTSTKRKPKKTKKFADFVRTPDKDLYIKNLHERIDGITGRNAIVLLHQEIMRGSIMKPSWRAFNEEFPNIICNSEYYRTLEKEKPIEKPDKFK